MWTAAYSKLLPTPVQCVMMCSTKVKKRAAHMLWQQVSACLAAKNVLGGEWAQLSLLPSCSVPNGAFLFSCACSSKTYWSRKPAHNECEALSQDRTVAQVGSRTSSFNSRQPPGYNSGVEAHQIRRSSSAVPGGQLGRPRRSQWQSQEAECQQLTHRISKVSSLNKLAELLDEHEPTNDSATACSSHTKTCGNALHLNPIHISIALRRLEHLARIAAQFPLHEAAHSGGTGAQQEAHRLLSRLCGLLCHQLDAADTTSLVQALHTISRISQYRADKKVVSALARMVLCPPSIPPRVVSTARRVYGSRFRCQSDADMSPRLDNATLQEVALMATALFHLNSRDQEVWIALSTAYTAKLLRAASPLLVQNSLPHALRAFVGAGHLSAPLSFAAAGRLLELQGLPFPVVVKCVRCLASAGYLYPRLTHFVTTAAITALNSPAQLLGKPAAPSASKQHCQEPPICSNFVAGAVTMQRDQRLARLGDRAQFAWGEVPRPKGSTWSDSINEGARDGSSVGSESFLSQSFPAGRATNKLVGSSVPKADAHAVCSRSRKMKEVCLNLAAVWAATSYMDEASWQLLANTWHTLQRQPADEPASAGNWEEPSGLAGGPAEGMGACMHSHFEAVKLQHLLVNNLSTTTDS